MPSNEAAGDGRTGGVASGYVEDSVELRTKLGVSFQDPSRASVFGMFETAGEPSRRRLKKAVQQGRSE